MQGSSFLRPIRSAAAAAVLTALVTLFPRPTSSQERPTAEQAERALLEELRAPRPIDAAESVWLEELTWMEIRDLIAAGTTTAIVSTGGIEQNGPYVAMGKHNYILQTTCPAIARELRNALCAPIIKLVPEGDIDEPSGHMRYPGTISVRQETFEMMLADVARSLKAHGFTDIVLIGDSGGNQRGMSNVASALNAVWTDARAHYIAEYYTADVVAYMNEELGIVEPRDDGVHDFYWITAQQMVTDPGTVRYDERVAAGMAHINGISIAPKAETIEVGRALIQFRVKATVEALRAAMGARP
jgi:creatinine amidohydrolase/Fe(II)-dependent formamide hydrolase-like protein